MAPSRSAYAFRTVLLLLAAAAVAVDAFGRKKKAPEPPPPPPPPVEVAVPGLQDFWTIVGAVVAVAVTLWLLSRNPSFPPPPPKKKCNVVVVCCGQPGKGMGWYHATNILDGECPSATLTDVVEPWFLGGGAGSPAGLEFQAFAQAHPAVRFHSRLADLPAWPKDGPKTVVLIAGRTVDNPGFLRAAVDKGASAIYLEKPGAPSVAELEACGAYASSRGVPVYMGYNKNVTKYVTAARQAERAHAGEGAYAAFYHNNAYAKAELPECFERNSEGMLKNMAVHELALLVTFYGVTATNIASVVPDKAYSSCQTLGKFTDFDKLGFTVTTAAGQTASVYADRCGGTVAEAVVRNAAGLEVARVQSPDDDLRAVFEAKSKAHPSYMPYFILQHDDYVTLKERVCAAVASGGKPSGVASLEIAVETLKVAEYLTPILQKELLGKK